MDEHAIRKITCYIAYIPGARTSNTPTGVHMHADARILRMLAGAPPPTGPVLQISSYV